MGYKRNHKSRRKREVWDKTGGVCAHCGKEAKGINKTIDHYIPKSKGGGYDERNLVPLCRKCNQTRGSRLIVAAEFYIYAPEWVIQECEEYELVITGRRWERCRHRMQQR